MSQQINLFNPIFLRERKHFSAKTMAQGLGLIAVFVLLMFGYSQYQFWKMNQEAVKTSARLKEAQQQLTTVTVGFVERKKNLQLEEQVKRAQQEVDAVQQAFTRLRSEEFGSPKGYSDYLRAFARQIVSGVWLTGFSIESGGSAIGIQGGAMQPELIPEYMNRLKREPIMQGKSFATFEIREHQAVEQKLTEQKPADQKPTDAAASKAAKKENVPMQPAYVEFDLRSEGVEKVGVKSATTSGAPAPAGGVSPTSNVSAGVK